MSQILTSSKTNTDKKVKMYRLKISLIGYHKQPIKDLHRIIDAAEDVPFSVLHRHIFMAFDRFDEHLYKFYLTRTQVKDLNELHDCTDVVLMEHDMMYEKENEAKVAEIYTLGEADLQAKECMYYWFDYGDHWVHRIRVEKVFYIKDEDPDSEGYYIDLVKKVGESPAQYDDDSIWNVDNEESLAEQITMTLLGMCVPDMPQKLTLADLDDVGILDIMIESGLIEKPAENTKMTIEAKLTEQGKLKGEIMLSVMKGEMDMSKLMNFNDSSDK